MYIYICGYIYIYIYIYIHISHLFLYIKFSLRVLNNLEKPFFIKYTNVTFSTIRFL